MGIVKTRTGAKEKESNLFQILFMVKSSLTPKEFVTKDNEDFKEFHVKMWIFTHGLATLVASETCDLTDEQISQLLSYGFQAFMLLEDNPNNKWILKDGKFVNRDQ